MRKVLLAITYLIVLHGNAQLYNAKWYFGGNAGLDFTTSPPTVISNTNVNTQGGMSSICDAAGNLLFYTDGATVWNRLHQVMASGTGLLGAPGGLQDVVIVPHTTNTSQYLVYTSSHLMRNIVDMSLAAGMGSVTLKNQVILANTINHVVASSGCGLNQVITRNLYNHWTNQVGQTAGGTSYTNSANSFTPAGSYVDKWLKVSPEGLTYAMISEKPNSGSGFYSIEIKRFFFNDPTFWGAPIIVASGAQLGDLFACEFSPDATKLYASSPNTHNIYQWDLCAGSQSAIANSIFTISTGSVSVYGLQLAPDGKIYCATNPSLSVINNPNLSGAACGFTLHQQSIGSASCGLVLPNFCMGLGQINLSPVSFSTQLTPSASCRSMTFNPISQSSFSNCSASAQAITSVTWDFGDPTSGVANTSTITNAVHVFSAPGTYTVRMVVTRSCRKDSVSQPITIPGPWSPVSLTGNFALCTNGSATITATGADGYRWLGQGTGSVLVVSPSITTVYTVVGTNSISNCGHPSTFTVTVAPCTGMVKTSGSQKILVASQHGVVTLRYAGDAAIERCSTIRIFDLTGRTVMTLKAEWHEGVARVPLGEIEKGVYFLSFYEREDLYPLRFLVGE